MIQIIIGAVALAAATALVYFIGRFVIMLGDDHLGNRHDGIKNQAKELRMSWQYAGSDVGECFAVGAGTILILAIGSALLWLVGSIIITATN